MNKILFLALGIFTALSVNAYAGETTCVVSKGDEPVAYGIKISDRPTGRIPGEPADVSHYAPTQDIQVIQGGLAIGSFPMSQIQLIADEGYYSIEVKVAGTQRLNLLVNGRSCIDHLCPAIWTQPGLNFKNEKAVCLMK